jgi:hypothetical protein
LSEASEGILVLTHAPDGWADASTEYARDKTYGSVMRKGSELDLTFYKEGKNFLNNVYENTGIDANVTLTVQKLRKSPYLAYETYPSPTKVDMTTYVIDEVGVTVKLVDSSFKEKIVNRDSVELDVLKLTSIDGVTIADFTNKSFVFPDTSISRLSNYTEHATGFITILEHVVPIDLVASDFTESQSPAYAAGDVGKKTGSFFKENLIARILTLDFSLSGSFVGSGAAFDASIDTNLVVIDSDEVEVVRIGIGQKIGSAVTELTFSYSKSVEYTLQPGQSLILQSTISTTTEKFSYDTISVTCNEVFTGNPEWTTTGLPYYEAFLRLTQLITGNTNPFYSEFLGRTDTPLTIYDADGETGYITKGIFMRLINFQLDKTLPLKLVEVFESLSSIFRLGAGFEQIGGVDKFRIEELDYFFDETVVVDISSQLRSENIEKQVIADMFYNSANVGFNKYEYLENYGLSEFNTSSSWTTIIKSVFNTFKKIAKYRADGQGMRLILNASSAADYDSTKDVKGDNDIFLVDTFRDGDHFTARTDEGFDYIGGSVYAASSFNVRYSPLRNFLRWGAEIKAGLWHVLNSILLWQNSDKNTTLESRLTTETKTVTENSNILADDLTSPKWYNEKFVIKAPLTVAQLGAIDANPNGLIKISDSESGWILSLKVKNKDMMADMELLRAKLTAIPTLTTEPVAYIYDTYAQGRGLVSDMGGLAGTFYGMCYGLTENPTIAGDHTVETGGEVGYFVSTMLGLTPGTLYHVRAYQSNSLGTGYGQDVTFTTAT